MKKQLPTINKARANGFFLPYTLFISMLVFLNITTAIILYENKIMTQRTMTELIEAETLVQMSKEKFKQNMHNINKTGKVNYTHPNGFAELAYSEIENNFEVSVTVHTDKGTDHFKHFIIYRGLEEVNEAK